MQLVWAIIETAEDVLWETRGEGGEEVRTHRAEGEHTRRDACNVNIDKLHRLVPMSTPELNLRRLEVAAMLSRTVESAIIGTRDATLIDQRRYSLLLIH